MFSIDRQYLTTTLTDLVRIDSTNPLCTPDGAGAAEIAAYVAGPRTYAYDPGLVTKALSRSHPAGKPQAVQQRKTAT